MASAEKAYVKRDMATKKGGEGFTLVELLIVIAVVGILSAIAIPIYRSQMLKARLVEVTHSMNAIAGAIGVFYQENNAWPVNNADALAIGSNLGIYVPTVRAQWSTGGSPPTIRATIQNISVNYPAIDGTTIELVATTSAGGAISWSWTGSIPTPFMPKQ